MLIIPTSRIILLKNPIEIDYANELTFTSKEAQYNYFYNLPKLECDNATYQRKDEVVRFPTDPNLEGTTFDDLIQYNYCMYQNDKWSDKWFYAFIKKVTFDNPGMSYIELETDVWQSWCFDITFKNSFIEREHVNNDIIGLHTIPEGLEHGEYVITGVQQDNLGSDLKIVMGSTVEVNDDINIGGGVYNGIPSGVCYYVYDRAGDYQETSTNTLSGALKMLAEHGRSDAVKCVFLAPSWLAPKNSGTVFVANTTSPITDYIFVSRIDRLNGYIPRNKKLLTHPYCGIVLSNNSGQATTYQQELWEVGDDGMTLVVKGCLTPGCSVRCYPYNYKGVAENYDEGISLGKYPSLNWQTDVYTNWLTQNGVSLGTIKLNAEQAGYASSLTNLAMGLAETAIGSSTGNIMSIASGMNNIKDSIMGAYNVMQEKYQHSFMSNTINGSLNCGDVITSSGINKFFVYKMTIKEEFARIIDKFFDVYGYKVNDFKVPNLTGRSNWNYVKTNSCNIIGNIPQSDINKIKEIFNKGITLWHNPNTFLDYSQSNNII